MPRRRAIRSASSAVARECAAVRVDFRSTKSANASATASRPASSSVRGVPGSRARTVAAERRAREIVPHRGRAPARRERRRDLRVQRAPRPPRDGGERRLAPLVVLEHARDHRRLRDARRDRDRRRPSSAAGPCRSRSRRSRAARRPSRAASPAARRCACRRRSSRSRCRHQALALKQHLQHALHAHRQRRAGRDVALHPPEQLDGVLRIAQTQIALGGQLVGRDERRQLRDAGGAAALEQQRRQVDVDARGLASAI